MRLTANAEAAADAAAQAEAEAEEDEEAADEPVATAKLSDLGLLRSFRPAGEEALGANRELHKQLQDAAAVLPTTRGATPAEAERIAKQARRQERARRMLVHQLGWTPNHAFSRAAAKPAFTDVACLLPLLLLWLVMLAIGLLGGEYGEPQRLLFGVDYERNTCGSNNAHPRALRFDTVRDDAFPYAVQMPNARFDDALDEATRTALQAQGLHTGTRDLRGHAEYWYLPSSDTRWLLAYAEPASRLAVCVSACPSPATIADGGSSLLCTYDASPSDANASCFPSYKTVAVHGYCVPTAPGAQSEYDAAGVALQAAELESLRGELLGADGRYFDATFADLLLSWPLLLGCPLVAAAFVLAWAVASVFVPSALFVLAVLISIASCSGLTYVFWSAGEEWAADAASSALGTSDDSLWHVDTATWLTNTAYCLCAFTACLPFSGFLLGRACLPSLPLLQVAGTLLVATPSALLAPIAMVLVQLLFVAAWTWGGVYLASAGELELLNAEGYARPTFGSGVKALLAVHAIGGLWTVLFLRQLALVAAAGPLARGYWRAAELRCRRPYPPTSQLLLAPLRRVGSACVGATLHLLLLAPLASLLQCCDVRSLDSFDEAGLVSVAAFGTSYAEGARWASTVTSRFVPRLLHMQSRCGLFLFCSNVAWAFSAAAIASCFLVGHTDYAKPSPFAADSGVSSIYLPLVATFLLAYHLGSTLLSTVHLAVAAAVQGWCLDYKQNCADQKLSGATWMMASASTFPDEEYSPLHELHELLVDELAHAALERKEKEKAAAQRASAIARRAAKDADLAAGSAKRKGSGSTRSPALRAAARPPPLKAPRRPASARAVAVDLVAADERPYGEEDDDFEEDEELVGGDDDVEAALKEVPAAEASARRRRPPVS